MTALTGTQCNTLETYETDEDEFLGSGEEEIRPAVPNTFPALYTVHVPAKIKNTAKRKWWMRMEVEGRMEVVGRKEARRMNKKEEEEKKCRRRMKKVINIKEVEKKETTEFESSSGCHQVLQKVEEISFEIWGEGDLHKSTGFEEK